MKILFRVLQVVLSLALLACLVLLLGNLVAVPGLSPVARQAVALYPWLVTVFGGVLVFFIAACALWFVLAVSVPRQRRHYTLGQGMGRIEISRQSIESVAENALAELDGLKRYHARLKGSPSPDRLRLYVRAEPKPEAALVPLAEEIQKRVGEALAACLDIRPEAVQVMIEAVQPTAQAARGRMPRVV